jgi:hypothetical protein
MLCTGDRVSVAFRLSGIGSPASSIPAAPAQASRPISETTTSQQPRLLRCRSLACIAPCDGFLRSGARASSHFREWASGEGLANPVPQAPTQT